MLDHPGEHLLENPGTGGGGVIAPVKRKTTTVEHLMTRRERKKCRGMMYRPTLIESDEIVSNGRWRTSDRQWRANQFHGM